MLLGIREPKHHRRHSLQPSTCRSVSPPKGRIQTVSGAESEWELILEELFLKNKMGGRTWLCATIGTPLVVSEPVLAMR